MECNSDNFDGLMIPMKEEERTKLAVNTKAIDSVFFRLEELDVQAWMLRV